MLKYLHTFFVVILYLFSIPGNIECWTPLESATKCTPENKTWLTPNCTFFYTESSLFNVSCISPGVLRFQGEFQSIKVTCTAFYLVDFFYYGIQPTEAIEIEYSKIVEPKTNRQNITFVVDVIVRSVKELQKYYGDKSLFPNDKTDIAEPTDADYSRSGEYIFNGLFNHSLETKFFIFFEDSAKPSFLRNAKTRTLIKDGNLIVPCIASHFDSYVDIITIQSKGNKNLTFSRKPTSGITVRSFDLKRKGDIYEGNYTCTMTHGNITDVLVLTYPDLIDPDSHFGLRDLPKEYQRVLDIRFDLRVISDDFLDVQPLCQVQNQSATNSLLSQIPSLNGGYDRLIREFVFPQFINRSYTVQTVTQPEKLIGVLKIHKLSNLKGERGGIAFCMSGMQYDVTDYGIPINYYSVIKFPYGVEWNTLPRNESAIEIHMSLKLENHKKGDVLYENTNLTASCLVLNGSMVKPTIWYTERKNHYIVEEFIDNNVHGFSYFTFNLTRDITRIYCAASYIHTVNFRNISMAVNVTEGISPVITAESYVVVFRLGYKNQFLKCAAHGKPTPELFWQDSNGNNISSSATYSKSILDFDKIEYQDAADYICVAKNDIGTSIQIFTVQVEIDPGSQVTNVTIVVGVMAALVMIGCAMALVYLQKRKTKKIGLTKEEINEFINGLNTVRVKDEAKDEVKDARKNSYKVNLTPTNYCRFDERPYVKEKEILESDFTIEQAYVLGSGQFGMIFKGSVNGKEVAVKTTKRNAEKAYLKALLSELKIMIYLGEHENVVNLIGASTKNLKEGQVFIFVEFCPFGSLESYLQNNRYKYLHKSSCRSVSTNNSEKPDSFCYNDLIIWTKQIAYSMDFLGNKQVIHGDLAARNVLLAENMQIKLTDFGLSRKMYNYSIYTKKNQDPLPWRWLALESLRDMTFSYESDIWSFGITIWEIFSLGEIPYPGYQWNMNFISELENGLRMARPKYASDLIYKNVMLACWDEVPNRRPSFLNLISQLDQYNRLSTDNEQNVNYIQLQQMYIIPNQSV